VSACAQTNSLPLHHRRRLIENPHSRLYNADTTLDRFEANRDYYEVLGAGEDSSPREIERLYKRLAHQRHPDRGGTEEEMKALNEAYQVLHDEAKRAEYDTQRRRPVMQPAAGHSTPATPAARDVGVYGQLFGALMCTLLGLMLLLLVHFNGLWFLWPLSILAWGVVFFGVVIAHSAMTNARRSFAPQHSARRFRALQEIAFWSLICAGGYGIYLILTTL
jgi:curved DNA-binding protein CbpA